MGDVEDDKSRRVNLQKASRYSHGPREARDQACTPVIGSPFARSHRVHFLLYFTISFIIVHHLCSRFNSTIS